MLKCVSARRFRSGECSLQQRFRLFDDLHRSRTLRNHGAATMNSRIFDVLSARYAPLSSRLVMLRHGHFWSSNDPMKIDQQAYATAQDAVPMGPPAPAGSARDPLIKVAQTDQRDAVNAWEDEGGTTKLATPR